MPILELYSGPLSDDMPDMAYEGLRKSEQARRFLEEFEERCPSDTRRFLWIFPMSVKLPLPEESLLHLIVERGLAADLSHAELFLSSLLNKLVLTAVEIAGCSQDWRGFMITKVDAGYQAVRYSEVF